MNNITKITTVRHAQTDYNVEGRYAGTIDVPLNQKGIEDATNTANRLIEYEFDIVIASGLQRAIQTAELLVAGRCIKIIQNELCNERDYGRMEGMNFIEVEDIVPRITYLKLNNEFHSLNPPGGEDFPALRKRAKAFSDFLFQNYIGFNILVVSSSAFMQQLHGHFGGLDWVESLREDVHNLTRYTFTFEGKELIEKFDSDSGANYSTE